MTEERMIVVASIGGAHGLDGQVRVRFFSDDPDAVCRRGVLYTRDDKNAPVLKAREILWTGKFHLVTFNGIMTREAAERLNGTLLYQPREVFPEPEDGEYYYADLVGLAARRLDGDGAFGRVIEVSSAGAGDVLTIRLNDEKGSTVMVPFINDAVPVVDIKGGFVRVADAFL